MCLKEDSMKAWRKYVSVTIKEHLNLNRYYQMPADCVTAVQYATQLNKFSYFPQMNGLLDHGIIYVSSDTCSLDTRRTEMW